MEDEIEWRPSSVAFFADGRSWPFTTPLDLLRFKPLSLPAAAADGPRRALRLSAATSGSSPSSPMTARDWIVRSMGARAVGAVWGPLLRGKFGDRAEDISMAWLWSKLTLRRQIKGEEARQEMLGYPRGSWQPLLERAARRRSSAGGSRVLIDRPAKSVERRASGFAVRPGAPDSFRRGHDPRRIRGRRRRGALRRRRRDGAERRLPRAARRRPARRDRRRLPGAARADRVPHGALPPARARPPVLALLLDQHRRPRAAVRRADRADELHRARRATAAGASSTSPTTSRPTIRLLALDPDGLLDALRARAAAGQPGLLTRLGAQVAGSSASRRPSRSSPSATRTASRRSRPACRGLCSRTRPRSTPRTAARTTASGSGTTQHERCSEPRERELSRRSHPGAGDGFL